MATDGGKSGGGEKQKGKTASQVQYYSTRTQLNSRSHCKEHLTLQCRKWLILFADTKKHAGF